MGDPGDPITIANPGPKHPHTLPRLSAPLNSPAGYTGTSAPPMSKANGVHLLATGFDLGENNGSPNANSNTKLEALRAQGQALSWIAQALLWQTQALNKQFDAFCSDSGIERSIQAPT